MDANDGKQLYSAMFNLFLGYKVRPKEKSFLSERGTFETKFLPKQKYKTLEIM